MRWFRLRLDHARRDCFSLRFADVGSNVSKRFFGRGLGYSWLEVAVVVEDIELVGGSMSNESAFFSPVPDSPRL